MEAPMLNLFKGFFSTKKETQAEEAASYFEQQWLWEEIQVAAQKGHKADLKWNNAILERTLKIVLGGECREDAENGAVWSLAGSEFEKNSEEAWSNYQELLDRYEDRY